MKYCNSTGWSGLFCLFLYGYLHFHRFCSYLNLQISNALFSGIPLMFLDWRWNHFFLRNLNQQIYLLSMYVHRGRYNIIVCNDEILLYYLFSTLSIFTLVILFILVWFYCLHFKLSNIITVSISFHSFIHLQIWVVDI
jgi:hypothetical protein